MQCVPGAMLVTVCTKGGCSPACPVNTFMPLLIRKICNYRFSTELPGRYAGDLSIQTTAPDCQAWSLLSWCGENKLADEPLQESLHPRPWLSLMLQQMAWLHQPFRDTPSQLPLHSCHARRLAWCSKCVPGRLCNPTGRRKPPHLVSLARLNVSTVGFEYEIMQMSPWSHLNFKESQDWSYSF